MSLETGAQLGVSSSPMGASDLLQINQPGFLTPIAISPRPFEISGTSTPSTIIPSMPMVTLPVISPRSDTPVTTLSTPIVSLRSVGAQPQLFSPFIQSPIPQSGIPSSLPSKINLSSISSNSPITSSESPIPSPRLPATPSINLPNVPPTGMPSTEALPFTGLPFVTLPGTVPRLTNLPSLGTLPNVVSSTLGDNETGPLGWERPNPPQPRNSNSSYRRIGVISDGSCFFHAISKGLAQTYQLSYKNFKQIREETLKSFESSIGGQILFPTHIFNPRRGTAEIYTIVDKFTFDNLMAHFRRKFVLELRRDFAQRILSDKSMQARVKEYLPGLIEVKKEDLICNQRLSSDKAENIAFTLVLRELADELLSGQSVKPDFIILLAKQIGMDIYLLRDIDISDPNASSNPLYGGVHLHSTIRGPPDMRPEVDIHKNEPNINSLVIIAVNDYHYDLVARVDTVPAEDGRSTIEIHSRLGSDEPLVRKLYGLLLNTHLERIASGEKIL